MAKRVREVKRTVGSVRGAPLHALEAGRLGAIEAYGHMGEFLIVPRGVEHRPVAPEETHVLLFEPRSTSNTGNVRSDRTVDDLERI